MNSPSSHGGNIYSAARGTGRPVDCLIDFSASINPLGPSSRAIQAVVDALARTAHYPDPDCSALRETLAKRLSLPLDTLVIGNGSSELIHRLPAALSIRRAVIVGPTFSEYARAVTTAKGRITAVHAEREERYRPPLDRVLSMVKVNRYGIDAVFLCNPNSPTGQVAPVQALRELLKTVPDQGIWLVIDETFIEYCEEQSVISQIGHNSRLVVLRSFTKFYGLPGLRIGYAVGPKDIIERIRQRQPPWSVNVLAQVAAQAALKDRRHARKSLAFMQAERRRLMGCLKSLPGLVVFPSAANFLLLELPGRLTAERCTGALRRQGLLVRDCSMIPGLTARTIRIAVRTAAQNRRLLNALRRMLKESYEPPPVR